MEDDPQQVLQNLDNTTKAILKDAVARMAMIEVINDEIAEHAHQSVNHEIETADVTHSNRRTGIRRANSRKRSGWATQLKAIRDYQIGALNQQMRHIELHIAQHMMHGEKWKELRRQIVQEFSLPITEIQLIFMTMLNNHTAASFEETTT